MYPTLEEAKAIAASGRYRRVPVSMELFADGFTPIEVIRTLRAASKHCFLLESAEDREQWGRYSFLGYAPSLELTCSGGVLRLTRDPEAIFLSPGPGRPEDAGVCLNVIRELAPEYPIFGVCLGHQAICLACGGSVSYAKELMHGKASIVYPEPDSRLMQAMDVPFKAARYHSLAAPAESLPDCLKVAARTMDGEVMAVEHIEYPVFGVQFHPESVLTPRGGEIIKQFFDLIGGNHHD